MIRLSVNVNKVATLRNARGGSVPSVVAAARACLEAGAPGITVHPRADARHITFADVHDVADLLAGSGSHPELNIEGDPRAGLVDLVRRIRPQQCTLVPVMPGEVTSQAGWPLATPREHVQGVIETLKADAIRVSLFVEPEERAIDWARGLGADRVELYTAPYARAFERGGEEREASLAAYGRAARRAHALGLGVNAGHDLDLDNLPLFATLPHLAEVSIGHALISHALFVGLSRAVADYLAALSPAGAANGPR
jgi:pyridoxine 5-phosphate synthase